MTCTEELDRAERSLSADQLARLGPAIQREGVRVTGTSREEAGPPPIRRAIEFRRWERGTMWCGEGLGSPHIVFNGPINDAWQTEGRRSEGGRIEGLLSGAEGWVGVPVSEELTGADLPFGLQDAVAQQFQDGIIVAWQAGAFAVPSVIYRNWMRLVREGSVDLGGPTDRPRRIRGMWIQPFSGGIVAATPDGDVVIVGEDGALLPRVPYELHAVEIRCVEESDGAGSDQFRLALVPTHYGAPTLSYRAPSLNDVDSGETYGLNTLLFAGDCRFLGTLAGLGLESDDDSCANDVLNAFITHAEAEPERALRELAEAYSNIDDDFGEALVWGVGAGAGAAGGTAALYGIIWGATLSTGSAFGIVAGGFLLGALYGAIDAWVTYATLPSPLFFVHRQVNLRAMRAAVLAGSAPAGTPMTDVGHGVSQGSRFELIAPGVLREEIHCVAAEPEDANYVLILEHRFPV